MTSNLLSNIPTELRKPPLWLQYYLSPDPKHPDKKPGKHPVVKYATPEARKANLRSLDYLLENRKLDKGGGYQRYVNPEEGFTYIDIDHVRKTDTEEVEPWAQEIVDDLDTYTEISASGTGLHLVCRARLPGDFKVDPARVEIYGSGKIPNKLLAMTGDVYGLQTTIEDRQQQAEELLRRAKAGKLDPKAPAAISKPTIVLSCSAKEPDTDMPDECLDGWLGEVCRTRMVHFPRAYAWPALLAAASALVPPGSKRCNLYVDLDGPVHSGKSAAYEAAFHLLSLRKPVLMEVKAGSAEGLVKLAGDTAGAGRLLYPDELSHLLEKSKIERAAFPSFLTTAFYKDEQTLTVSKREVLEFNARLSVAGCTVDDQFADLFGAATTGGLHDRFLFGKCPDGYVHLWRDPAEQEPAFVPVAADDSFAPPERPVPVEIDKDVYRERDRWVKELGINPRVAEICLRAAVVTASFDGRRRLTADKLGPALALARYQERVRLILRPNPGENPDARMAFMIRSWLTANVKDSGWTGKRELNRRIHATERLGPGVFDRALNNLRFTGELEFNKIGRVEVLRLRPEDEVSPPKPGTNGDAL